MISLQFDIQTDIILGLHLNDDVLKKNFRIIINNFQTINRKLNFHQSHIQRLLVLPQQNADIRSDIKQIQHRLDTLTPNQSKIEKNIISLENKLSQLYVNQADHEAKWIENSNFKRMQSRFNEWQKQKIQHCKHQIQELIRTQTRFQDNLSRKGDKSELEKAKKQLTNMKVMNQTEKKKMDQIDTRTKEVFQNLDKLHNIEDMQKELINNRKSLVGEVIDQLKPYLSGDMVRRSASKIDSYSSLKNQSNMNMLQFSNEKKEYNSIVEELQVKVNRLIEHEKKKIARTNSSQHRLSRTFKDQDKRIQQFMQLFKLEIQKIKDKLSMIDKNEQNNRFLIQTAEERLRVQTHHVIQTQIKQLQAQFTVQFKKIINLLQYKISNQEFHTNRRSMEANMADLVRLLDSKPNKQDVKHGFIFIQHKLKELISTVLVDDVKKQRSDTFKCLSCQNWHQELIKEGPVRLRKCFFSGKGKSRSSLHSRQVKSRQTIK